MNPTPKIISIKEYLNGTINPQFLHLELKNNCDNIGTFWYQINGVLQLSQKLLGKKIDLFLGILKRAKFMKLPVDAPAKNSKK